VGVASFPRARNFNQKLVSLPETKIFWGNPVSFFFLPFDRGAIRAVELQHPAVRPFRVDLDVGLYPIATLQYSPTNLYQVSNHIQ
jgi:hypothetical protein